MEGGFIPFKKFSMVRVNARQNIRLVEHGKQI